MPSKTLAHLTANTPEVHENEVTCLYYDEFRFDVKYQLSYDRWIKGEPHTNNLFRSIFVLQL